jgi:hypothetical protein
MNRLVPGLEWNPREHCLDETHFRDGLRATKSDMATINLAWASFAESRSMVHQHGQVAWFDTLWPRVEGLIDGLPVALEAGQREGFLGFPVGVVATAARAFPPTSMSGHLTVRYRYVGSRIAQLFGIRDFQTGNGVFDRTYIVRTTDESLALALLSPSVCNEALVLGCRRIIYDDGSASSAAPHVMIDLPGVVVTKQALDRMLRLVVQLARAQQSTNAAYR